MLEKRIYDLLPDSLPKVIGDLPSTASNAVAIMAYDGVAGDAYFHFGAVFAPTIKIVVRNNSYEEAQLQILDIRQALHRHTDEYFLSIMLRGYPIYLGRDEQKFHEFQIVFNVQVKE